VPFGPFKRRKESVPAPAAAPPAPGAPAPAGADAEPLRVYGMGPSQEMRYTVELLAGKGLEFETIDVSADAGLQSWVKRKTGSNEYPQVFRGSQPLGDFGTLRQLDFEGNLDRVLRGLPPIAFERYDDDPSGQDERQQVRARLRRGDVLSLTTADGETFDTWAEVYANPPRIYYRGEPHPIEALDAIVGELVGVLADPRTEAAWSRGS
jgi:glutaredoxin